MTELENANKHRPNEVLQVKARKRADVSMDAMTINLDPFSYDDRLRRLKKFVTESYAEQVSVSQAAKVTGMAEKYFSTYFHQTVGKTFSSWLREYRINRAKDLLKSRLISITEVAFGVGFNSLSTFGRAFKALTGVTPSQYKRWVMEQRILSVRDNSLREPMDF